MDKRKKAEQNAADGRNCCQSVFTTFCEDLGIDEQTGLKISAGLGAGVYSGEVCGAVTGAVLAMGLVKGEFLEDNEDPHQVISENVRKFTKEFRDRHGSIICRELLGRDISREEELEKARDEGLFERLCRNYIGTSAEIIGKYLDGSGEKND